jgi:hypothetical protein
MRKSFAVSVMIENCKPDGTFTKKGEAATHFIGGMKCFIFVRNFTDFSFSAWKISPGEVSTVQRVYLREVSKIL